MGQPEQKTLDLDQARQLRDEGIRRVTMGSEEFLKKAREIARVFAREAGEVTSDDVRRVLEAEGIEARHPNSWGGVFKHDDFEFTGRYRQSTIVSRHAAIIRVWQLKQR